MLSAGVASSVSELIVAVLVSAVPGENVGYLIDTWDWVVGDGAMDQLSEIASDKRFAEAFSRWLPLIWSKGIAATIEVYLADD